MKNIPKSIVRNIFILIIAVAVVLATHIVRKTVIALEAEPEILNAYLDMVNANDKLSVIIDKYQKNINEMFNKKIKKMVAKMSDEKDPVKLVKLVSPPEKKKDESAFEPCKGDGEDENLSTYCLSQILVPEYFNFRDAMTAARNREQNRIGERYATLNGNAKTQKPEDSIQTYGKTINDIDREIEVSKQALDQSLAIYNEMQMALPLHRKYQDIIKALGKYRDKISDLRKEIEKYPPTFLDVTTTSCT